MRKIVGHNELFNFGRATYLEGKSWIQNFKRVVERIYDILVYTPPICVLNKTLDYLMAIL